MGYSIIFETKIVKLQDGRILHLNLSGCNNDTSGRSRNEFTGKIYTEDEFVKYANSFKDGSKPIKESDNFDLKIGSKFSTLYDYGEHLLRMLKRATTWEKICNERYCYGTVFDGVEVTENGKTTLYTPNEWEKICYDFMYGKRKGNCYRKTRTVKTESEIVSELENGNPMEFMIGKKLNRRKTA